MNIEKLSVSDEKFNLNLKFYFWLKHLVKTKLTDRQACDVLEIVLRAQTYDYAISSLYDYAENINKNISKKEAFLQVIETIHNNHELKIFLFSLRLYLIKDLLLAEAKTRLIAQKEDLVKLAPLSLEYDKKSLLTPYSTRVNGALLSLLFFDNLESGKVNLISEQAHSLISSLSEQAISLKADGLEPNQIFMLMFSESINQSIISDAGTNYEDRIKSVLLNIGIDKNSIKKAHDKADKSTEFDFIFTLDGRTYGIGAKKTLRERYKKFIKTAITSYIDVIIEVTLGLDLNEEKARTIINHGTIIFVADEIYRNRPFLQKINGIYSAESLTLEMLKSL